VYPRPGKRPDGSGISSAGGLLLTGRGTGGNPSRRFDDGTRSEQGSFLLAPGQTAHCSQSVPICCVLAPPLILRACFLQKGLDSGYERALLPACRRSGRVPFRAERCEAPDERGGNEPEGVADGEEADRCANQAANPGERNRVHEPPLGSHHGGHRNVEQAGPHEPASRVGLRPEHPIGIKLREDDKQRLHHAS
jgi:hypothetical protein